MSTNIGCKHNWELQSGYYNSSSTYVESYYCTECECTKTVTESIEECDKCQNI